MTAPHRFPEILDLLALNIRDASESARALVGAQDLRLHLGPDLEWARARLAGAGLAVSPRPLAAARADADPFLPQGLRRLPMAAGSPTDFLDIGLDLDNGTGAPVAMLELGRVPAGWASRDRLKGVEHLRTLLTRQVDALAGGPAIVAQTVLRLVTLLRELDDNCVSHSFAGLLHALAGKQPSRVEVMALRICGLAGSTPSRTEGHEVVLSDVALDLLDQAGMGRTAVPLALVPAHDAAMPRMMVEAPQALAPFARARIVERDYDVAEDEPSGLFWFRPTATEEPWVLLANNASDGWAAIAAEILCETSDMTVDFAQMHLIRRRDLPTDQVAEAYELNGTVWWLRDAEAGLEARLEGGTWQPCAVDRDLPAKQRALGALMMIDPAVTDRMTDQVRDWTRRMAQSVQVVPYMSIAAE